MKRLIFAFVFMAIMIFTTSVQAAPPIDKCSKIQSNLDSAQAQLSAVQSQLASAQSELASVLTQRDSARGLILSAQEQIASANYQKSGLEAETRWWEGEVITNQLDVNYWTSVLELCKDEVVPEGIDCASAPDSLANSHVKLTFSQSQVASMKSQIAALDSQIAELTGQIASLEAQIAGLEA